MSWSAGPAPLRVDFVAGVSPDKWARRWADRVPDRALHLEPVEASAQLDGVRDGSASMALVRLPVERDGLHLIPLYEEDPVVLAPRDHVLAAFEEVDVADLAEEVLVQGLGVVPEWDAVATADARARAATMPPMTDAQVVEVVASGAGIAVLPLSLARLHHRKDVVHRPVTGVAGSRVGLAWRVDDEDPGVELFTGIVRGRTANSSRGASATSSAEPAGSAQAARGRAQQSSGSGRSASGSGRGRSGGRALPQRGAAPRRGGSTRGRRRGR